MIDQQVSYFHSDINQHGGVGGTKSASRISLIGAVIRGFGAWQGCSLWKTVSVENLRSGKTTPMIFGAHVIVYSKDAAADRAFLRDVLRFTSVDAGHGWLIFALPPAEVAVHPAEENDRPELYLMCDDLRAAIAVLAEKGVQCTEVQEARWGSIVKVRLPGGGEVGLYQPKHPTALNLAN